MKKSWLIALILLVCWSSNLWAQGKPKIEPAEWPVGEVELEQHHQIRVKVINTTNDPITITKARPSCECLKSKIVKAESTPNSPGLVDVFLHVDHTLNTRFKIYIYIHINNDKKPLHRFNVIGKIKGEGFMLGESEMVIFHARTAKKYNEVHGKIQTVQAKHDTLSVKEYLTKDVDTYRILAQFEKEYQIDKRGPITMFLGDWYFVGYDEVMAKLDRLLNKDQIPLDKNAIEVFYFYSVGCGGCYDIEKKLFPRLQKKSGGAVISSFDYTHDNVGNRLDMTLANGDVIDYEYDDIYQLTEEARTGSITYTNTWTYDEVGNRLTQVVDSTTTTNYTYNDANQLTIENTGSITTTHNYDANGNLITKTQGANVWSYSYDYEDRQISFDAPGTTNDTTYTYCALGKRIVKNANGVAEKYIYAGDDIIIDLDGSNNVTATYVTPFLDQNLLVTRSSNDYYYMQDGLGSVRHIIDSSENTKNTYDYYAFGKITSETENILNRYKFTGREWGKESQLYHHRTRQYNPYLGTFTSRDPFGDNFRITLYGFTSGMSLNLISLPESYHLGNGWFNEPIFAKFGYFIPRISVGYLDDVNLYQYVHNNPSNFIDPLGLYDHAGEDVHYKKTKEWGIGAGLCPEQAEEVAWWDRSVDKYTPAWQREHTDKHFGSRKDAIKRLMEAIKNCGNPALVGEALHSFQDSYSHAGIGPGGHVWAWFIQWIPGIRYPDTFSDDPSDKEMEDKTKEWLERLKDHYDKNCIEDLEDKVLG